MTRPYAIVLGGTAMIIGAVLLVSTANPELLRTSNTMQVEDFGAYWTATNVNNRGGNAYDEAQLLPAQQAIEPDRMQPVAAWSPPWTFGAFAPFSVLDFAAARWAWRFFQIGTIFAAATALWRVYGGPPDKLIWAWCAALVWYPTLQTLGLGQHSNLVLLGIVGWLACIAAERRFAAGAFLALVLVKPQNMYLVGLAIAISTVDRRDWRLAIGAIAGTVAFTILALVPNPAVFGQYLEALTNRPPSNMVPPTTGMFLRMAFGEEHFWLIFVPPTIGSAWVICYYIRHRSTWRWPERLPLIVLVSCITSPYGWMYDQILFMIPIVAVLAPASQRSGWLLRGVVLIAGLTALCLALHSAGLREVTFVWHAPLCLGLYLASRKVLEKAVDADSRQPPQA